jgi:hypothetical protein
MADRNIKIALILSAIDNMSNVVNKAVSGLNKIKDTTDKLSKSSFAIGKGAGAVGVGLAGLLTIPVKAAADMEKMQIALRTSFMGSRLEAERAFDTINKFAAQTPYELEEVMQGFIKLKNMGLDPSNNALNAYGNTASAMGKSLNDMIEAVADAATGEFERLKEFGIRASSQGKFVTFTFQGVSTKVRKTSADIEKYLIGIGNTKFAGGIEDQSKSIYGQLSTLKDTLTMIASTIGKLMLPKINELFARIKPVIESIGAWVQRNPKLTEQIIKVTAGAMALSFAVSGVGFAFGGLMKVVSVTSAIMAGFGKVITFLAAPKMRLLRLLVRARQLFNLLSLAVINVGKAFAIAGKFLWKNPIILIIGVIAGAAYLIWKNWDWIKKNVFDPIAPYFKKVWDTIRTIFMAAVKFVGAIFLNFTPLGLVIKHWNKLSPYFNKIWNYTKTIFSGFWAWVKNLFLNYTPYGLIFKHWGKIKTFFSILWKAAKQPFIEIINWIFGLGAMFEKAGKKIMSSIWKGIKSAANMPFDEMVKAVGKVRNLLPFSPAKEGPLRDIHRIKLIETIAESIKPKALLDRMTGVTRQVFDFNGPRGGRPSPAGAGPAAGHVFNFEIKMSPGAPGSDVSQIKTEIEKAVLKALRTIQGNKERLSY